MKKMIVLFLIIVTTICACSNSKDIQKNQEKEIYEDNVKSVEKIESDLSITNVEPEFDSDDNLIKVSLYVNNNGMDVNTKEIWLHFYLKKEEETRGSYGSKSIIINPEGSILKSGESKFLEITDFKMLSSFDLIRDKDKYYLEVLVASQTILDNNLENNKYNIPLN